MIWGWRFWQWWRAEIAFLVPSWFRIAFLGGSSATMLVFVDGIAQLRKRNGRLEAPLELTDDQVRTISGRRKPVLVDVVLPENALLKRPIEAPGKVRSKLHSLASLDFKRNTPIPEGAAVWALGGERSEGNRVFATQYVAKTGDLSALRRRLAELNLTVRRYLAETPGGAMVTLQDLSGEATPGAIVWRRLNAALALAAVVTCGYLWLQPAWQARVEMQTLDAELATLRAEAMAKRRELDDTKAQRGEENRLSDELRHRARLVETLHSVTVALPDEAWISSLTFNHKAIILSGETSGSAVDLILGLSADEKFGNPHLSGPTVRTSTDRERFEIAAQLGGAP